MASINTNMQQSSESVPLESESSTSISSQQNITEKEINSKKPTNRGKKVGIFLAIIVVICVAVGSYFMFFQNKLSSHQSLPTAQNTQGNDTNTVTIWAWNTAAKALEELIPEFNKQYPNIHIKVVEIPHDDAIAKFRLAITTGTGFPDIMDSEGPVTPEFIKSGALLDITDKASQYKNDFVSYKWAEVSQNGKVYGLPWDSAPVGLFYRRDIFAKAGVDPNSIATWDDYIAAGKKITKAPNQYMTFISRTADVQDTFQIFLSQLGGSPFDANGNPSFDSPEGIASVKLMKRIYDAGIAADIPWWSTDMFSAIKSGKVASFSQGVWMGGQVKTAAPDTAGKWGIIPLPAVVPGGVRTAVRGGSNLAITAKSKHTDEAWKFIQFALANKNNQLKMYKSYDIFPALLSTYDDPIFKQPNSFYNNQDTSKLFIDAQSTLPQTYHYGTRYDDTMKIISAEIIQAITNKKTPEQALSDANKEVKSLLKE